MISERKSKATALTMASNTSSLFDSMPTMVLWQTRNHYRAPRLSKICSKRGYRRPDLLTVDVMARRLGVALHKVENIIRSRNIRPCCRAGSAYLYSQTDMDYIARQIAQMDEEINQPRYGRMVHVSVLVRDYLNAHGLQRRPGGPRPGGGKS